MISCHERIIRATIHLFHYCDHLRIQNPCSQTPMTEGFHVKDYGQPVKRYVQTMDLKDDPELIAEYRRRHSQEESWKEIRDGIREVGILDMQIFILGTRLVMIVETGLDFDWDSAMARLATLPRQQEWEDYMAIFQKCAEGATSDEKWQMMDRIFYLY